MAFSLLKVKSVFASNAKNRLPGSGSLEQEIGFKLVFNKDTSCLYVTVLGARHLPSMFGMTSVKGYVVKVKVFPGSAKFESQIQTNSWPVWNEEFKFQLGSDKKNKKSNDANTSLSQLAGCFLSLTVYAILENATKDEKNKKKDDKSKKQSGSQNTPSNKSENETDSTLAKFEKIMSSTFKGSTKNAEAVKSMPEKRRTVGAATWHFDTKLFQNDLKHDLIGTPDIWRPISQINSGVSPPTGSEENKKGQVEVTLLYNSSEDGCNDTLQINVNKMRCSIQTMQEHELRKEPLYIKASISDGDTKAQWKSDRFFPTISAKWDPKTSCARLRFNSKRIHNVSIYISVGCKNSMSVKEIFGKVVISDKTKYADFYQKLIDSPGVSQTQWFSFE